jgi:hypothetical protein
VVEIQVSALHRFIELRSRPFVDESEFGAFSVALEVNLAGLPTEPRVNAPGERPREMQRRASVPAGRFLAAPHRLCRVRECEVAILMQRAPAPVGAGAGAFVVGGLASEAALETARANEVERAGRAVVAVRISPAGRWEAFAHRHVAKAQFVLRALTIHDASIATVQRSKGK